MKTTIFSKFGIPALAVGVVALSACKGNEEPQEPTDTGVQVTVDMGEVMTDAGEPDAGTIDVGVDAGMSHDFGVTCSREDFTPAIEQASTQGFGLQYTAVSTTGTPFDRILVQIYSDFGGPTEPGTYTLDGINYADCGLCLLAFSGCETGASCEKTFYAEQGEVEITALGGVGDQFAAVVKNVVFDEVTIDQNTFQSTPVQGGEDWCVSELPFDQEIIDPAAPPCERDDITCLGETVPDFMLQNCGTEEFVSFYDMIAGDKAAHIVLTAGWCPACRQWMPQVVEQDNRLAGQGYEVVYILGEDANFAQPTLNYCRQYAMSYTDASNLYIDHSGQAAFSTTFDNMWPYISADGTFGLPWNSVVDPRNYEYRYADRSGQPEGLSDVVNELLSAP